MAIFLKLLKLSFGGNPYEMYDIGVVIPPKKRKVSSDFSSMKQVVSSNGNACGVLKALLDERNTGHGKPRRYKGVSGRKRPDSC
ncbi:MAG: hypothetical protein ABIN18_01505 [Pseudomonadota bacterium]